MPPAPPDDSPGIPCHRCGYDVRAQPPDGVCPECGADVAESRRLSAIPLRPAWRDSDPRWRRRILAGCWTLTLVPLEAFLSRVDVDERIPTPTFLQVQGTQTLRESYLPYVYPLIAFVVGVVLLFARERGRRRTNLDWTRRWGVVASYLVAFLGAIPLLFITALVMNGIAALFLMIPPAYAPTAADPLVGISCFWIWRGPHPSPMSDAALPAVSAIAVLLACGPLYDALRSCGRRGVAIALVVPLAVGSMRQLAHVAIDSVDSLASLSAATWTPTYSTSIYPYYFGTGVLAQGLASFEPSALTRGFFVEAMKWLACAAIAMRLTYASMMPLRRVK